MKSLPIIISLLAYPCLVTAIALVGFVVSAPVQRWYAPLAFVLSMLIALAFANTSAKRRDAVVVFATTVLLAIFLSSLPVMYCVSDALNCYRVGVAMMTEGWNPLIETEVSDIVKYGHGFNPWHVAYAFKIPFIFGASLCKSLGFSSAGDSLNFILLAASFIAVYTWLRNSKLLPGTTSYILAVGLILSPNVVRLLIGGKCDPALFQCVVVMLVGLDFLRMNCHSGWGVPVLLSIVLASGIKPTGLLISVVIMMCFAACEICLGLKKGVTRRRIVGIILFVLGTASVAIVMNPSPLITSTIKHGTPLYPMQTKGGTEVPQSVTQLTGDCDIMNDDARELGFVGRYIRAYISETAVDAIKSWQLHRPFNPEWPELFTKPTGLGPFFRFIYFLALIGWFFVKDRSVRWMAFAIFMTTLIIPIKFIGLANYVQQIYLFPPLVAIGLWLRVRENFYLNKMIVLSFLGYFLVLSLPSLSFVPYVWLSSVQNLQILDEIEKDENAIIESRYYYGQFLWKHDSNRKVVVVDNVDDLQFNSKMLRYSPVARRYDYLRSEPMPNYYNYSFAEVPRQHHAKRREGAASYFVKEFLPREYRCVWLRVKQWSRLRLRQIMNAWSNV